MWKCALAWLAGGETKKKTVWFYGAPNTGKTTMAQYFSKIFDSVNLTLKGTWTHDGNFELHRQTYSPNLVVLNEINTEYCFGGTQLEDMKTLMEGAGYCTNKKHKALVK